MSDKAFRISVVAAIVCAIAFIGGFIWLGIAMWPKPLSNDQILKATKQCIDADMYPEQLRNGITYEVTKVQCTPKQ